MKKGEIWLLEFPSKGTREQKGVRPGIIMADTRTDLIMTIPLTSNLQALRFPNTIEIKKSEMNKLEKDSIALVFQLQSLDRKRFLTKIGEIENSYIKQIKSNLSRLLEL